MSSITSLTREVDDPIAAKGFYADSFGLDDTLSLRSGDAPTDGFRSFTLPLVVSQPATVEALIGAALQAGARSLKPVTKTLWGYGGVIQAPDGTIWKVATSSKKNTGVPSHTIDEVVVLVGAADLLASKRYYAERGFAVAKSLAANTSSSTLLRMRSSWPSMDTAPWPRTLASRRQEAVRTESSWAAQLDRSSTRMDSSGRAASESGSRSARGFGTTDTGR